MVVIMVVMVVMLMVTASALTLENVHFQPNKGRGELKELRMLCAEDEQGRTCWMTAFRLFKVTRCCKKVYNFLSELIFFLFWSHQSIYTTAGPLNL